MKIISIIVVFLCTISLTVAHALTLNESLIGAYNYNPELLAKREEVKAIDEYMYQAISGFLPKIYFQHKSSINSSNRKNIRTTNGASKDGSDGSNEYDYSNITPKRNKVTTKKNSMVMEYNLFKGGASATAISKAKAIINRARVELALIEAKILFECVSAYTDVIYKKELVAIYNKNLDYLRKTLEVTHERFKAGVVKKTEISIIEREVLSAESLLVRAKADLIKAHAKFKQSTGFDASNLEPVQLIINHPKNMDSLVAYAIKNNPNIIASQHTVEAVDCDLRAALAGFWPNVDLYNEISNTTNKYNNYNSPAKKDKNIIIQLSLPLYNQGVEYSKTRQANATLKSYMLQHNSVVENIKQKAVEAWSLYIASESSYRASEKAVKAANVVLDGSIHEYQEGLISVTDLLENQRRLLSAQSNMHQAAHEKVNYAYNILAIQGKFNAQDLALETKYYDPAENYNARKLQFIGF